MPTRSLVLAALLPILFWSAVHATPAAMPLLEPNGKALTLRDAVDRALRGNLGLAITRNDVDIADAGITRAEAAFDATLSFSSAFNRFQSAGASYVRRGEVSNTWSNNASLYQRFSTGTEISLFTRFDPDLTQSAIASPDIGTRTGVSVRQSLIRGASIEVNLAPIARARLNLDRSRVNMRISAVNLIRDVEIAYRRLAAERELLQIRENALRAANSLLNEIKIRRRPEIGTATELDELEAAAEVAARRVDITVARGSYEAAADQLRRLLGDSPPTDTEPDIPLVEVLPTETPAARDFRAFMTKVHDFNPEFELGDINIRDAGLAVKAAINANSASLDFVVGASTLGRSDDAWSAISGQWNNNGSALSVGFELNVPLGLRESEAALRIARRQREQTVYRLADIKRSVGYEARAVWRDLSNARERLEVARNGVAIQERAYAGVRARNARGLASINDVLQAATRLDHARIARLNAALDYTVADARRARLDGDILSRNGLRWSEVDDNAGTDTNEPLEAPHERI